MDLFSEFDNILSNKSSVLAARTKNSGGKKIQDWFIEKLQEYFQKDLCYGNVLADKDLDEEEVVESVYIYKVEEGKGGTNVISINMPYKIKNTSEFKRFVENYFNTSYPYFTSEEDEDDELETLGSVSSVKIEKDEEGHQSVIVTVKL